MAARHWTKKLKGIIINKVLIPKTLPSPSAIRLSPSPKVLKPINFAPILDKISKIKKPEIPPITLFKKLTSKTLKIEAKSPIKAKI